MGEMPDSASVPRENTRLLEENRRLAQRYLELEETTRKQLEKLRAANDVLGRGDSNIRILLENASAGFALLDLGQRIVSANRTLCEILGYSQSELPGDLFTNHVYVGKLPEFSRLVGDTPARTAVNETVELVARDGRLVPCRMAVSDWLDNEGASQGVFILIFDIGEEKRAAERLQELESKVVELSKARNFFLEVVSRELRAPASGIMGMIRLLMDASLNERQAELAGVIHTSASSLVRLVDDLVDICRLDSDDTRLRPTPQRLADLAQSAADLFRVRAEEKGLELATHISPGAPERLVLDADRVRRVLSHLIDNAVKFTARGRVILSVDTVGGAIRFMVSDTGGGVPVNPNRDIFNLSASPSTTGDTTVIRHGGVGMGLAICRRLVNLMGGKIGFESEPGRGSEFHFTLPMVMPDKDAQPEQPQQPPETPHLPPLSILLADGNPVSRRIARAFLQFDSHRLTLTDNGPDAAVKGAGGDFDVIILDLHLPKLDGLQTLRLIRDEEKAVGRSRIPILLLGAPGQMRELGYYTRAGADGVVKKPVKPAELMAAIAAATGTKPLPKEEAAAPGGYSASLLGSALHRIDGAALAKLQRAAPGDVHVGLYRHYVEDVAPGLEKLREMVLADEPDREAISAMAAKEQSLAAHLGFFSLAEIFGRMESAARKRVAADILRSMSREISPVLIETLDELRKIMPEAFPRRSVSSPDSVVAIDPSAGESPGRPQRSEFKMIRRKE